MLHPGRPLLAGASAVDAVDCPRLDTVLYHVPYVPARGDFSLFSAYFLFPGEGAKNLRFPQKTSGLNLAIFQRGFLRGTLALFTAADGALPSHRAHVRCACARWEPAMKRQGGLGAFQDRLVCAILNSQNSHLSYSWGPAATRALPASLLSYLTKFLMKRPARSLAFSSQTAGSA